MVTLSMMTQLLSLAMTPIFTLLPMQHCLTVMVFSAAMSLPPSPIRLISFFSTVGKRAQGVRWLFLCRMMSLLQNRVKQHTNQCCCIHIRKYKTLTKRPHHRLKLRKNKPNIQKGKLNANMQFPYLLRLR